MTCKNCKHEFDKGKFCPECGFPIEGKKSNSEEAMELLKDTNARLKKLEAAEEARSKRRKDREDAKEKTGNGSASKRTGILDIF